MAESLRSGSRGVLTQQSRPPYRAKRGTHGSCSRGVAGGKKKEETDPSRRVWDDDLLCPFSGKVCVLKSVEISNSSSHNSASKQRTRSNTAATAAPFHFLHPITRSSSSCRKLLRPIKILRHQRLWALSPASSSASVSSIVLTNILFLLAIVVPFPTCCPSPATSSLGNQHHNIITALQDRRVTPLAPQGPHIPPGHQALRHQSALTTGPSEP